MVTDEDLDELGMPEVQHRRDRGDWIDATELKTVDSWLHRARKEKRFREACERASKAAALDAKRFAILSNLIAALALVVSVAALIRG